MIISIFLFFFFVPFYFLPTFVVGSKKADKKVIWAVVLINVFAGWTGVGWIIALIVAASAKPSIHKPE